MGSRGSPDMSDDQGWVGKIGGGASGESVGTQYSAIHDPSSLCNGSRDYVTYYCTIWSIWISY